MNRLFIIAVALIIGPWSPAAAQSPDCRTGSEASRNKNHKEAIELLGICLNSTISNEYRVSMLIVRAQSYMALKNHQLATKDLEEAIALDKSRNAWPWIIMSKCLREQKKYDKALDAIKEAEKLDEDGPGTGPGMAVYYHKGQALHGAGRYKEAVKAYTRGISEQPDYGWAFYQRALAYEAMGNRVQARRDMSRVAALNPKGGYEAHIVKKLRKYGFNAKIRDE
jgi:tetratricopeptide (TPR) repeat protein